MCFFSQVCIGQASLLVWVAGEDWCRVLQKEQTQVAEVGRVGEWGPLSEGSGRKSQYTQGKRVTRL